MRNRNKIPATPTRRFIYSLVFVMTFSVILSSTLAAFARTITG